MPKDIQVAHQTTISILNEIRIADEKKSLEKLNKKNIKKYSYENDKYVIVVPQSMQEIINEGKVQHHCVGGYADRHAQGKLVILFLRKKSNPQKAFYTIEVDPVTDKIKQCRGFRNNATIKKPQEIYDFEKAFEYFLAENKKHKTIRKKSTKNEVA